LISETTRLLFTQNAQVPAHCMAVVLTDATILLCGGWQNRSIANTCYLYTPSLDKWDEYAWPMQINREGHALSLYDGNVYAYGGRTTTNHLLSSIELLSYSKGWRLLDYTMNMPDAYFASAVLPEPTPPSLRWLLITAICIAVFIGVIFMCNLLVRRLRRLGTRLVFINDVQLTCSCVGYVKIKCKWFDSWSYHPIEMERGYPIEID